MPSFEFLAVNSKKETVSSTIEATDRLSAINLVKTRGLKLISIKEQNSKSSGFTFGKKKGVKTEELVMACQFFARLVQWRNMPRLLVSAIRLTLLSKTLRVEWRSPMP